MRILDLIIHTKNLVAQTKFYQEVLGFTLLKNDKNSSTFSIGSSRLTLQAKEEASPYHFAFNIPANQENEAHRWLKSRLELLKDGDLEIQNFDFWNAKAIYFYDKDKNIVEFIARKNLANESKKEFNAQSILEISEIGVPTLDIENRFKELESLSRISVFDGSFERFCAIGDEYGLFIVINKKIKNWFPVEDKAYSSPFEILFSEQGENYRVKFENDRFIALKNTVNHTFVA